jgi:hypothetical protein
MELGIGCWFADYVADQAADDGTHDADDGCQPEAEVYVSVEDVIEEELANQTNEEANDDGPNQVEHGHLPPWIAVELTNSTSDRMHVVRRRPHHATSWLDSTIGI